MTADDASQPKSDEILPLKELVIPPQLPVLPVREHIVFPGIVFPIVAAKPSEAQLVDAVLAKDRLMALVAVRDTEKENPGPTDLYHFGVAVTIVKMLKFPDNTTRILVQGVARIELKRYVQHEPFLVAEADRREDMIEENVELTAQAKNLVEQFHKFVDMSSNAPDELKVVAMNVGHPGKLADLVCANMSVGIAEKQKVLECLPVHERLQRVTGLLSKEIEVLDLSSKIQSQVQSAMGKSQREYYLREQLKAIQKELGEGDEHEAEIQELHGKIKEAKMPPEAEKEAERELDRLRRMHPSASEYSVSRTYLDWLITLPWSKCTEDNLDIARAQQVLDEDHYDLEKVKDRVVEYLAVRKLKPDMKGPILCFVGPPGVGKTSLGRSIARALEREFMRISLGGVRDEAEIRGHRRTYVGALPGRIIQGIRRAGSSNPVFMLDEIDKLGADFRGDPSAALLEVLDPEQNFSFMDHYLDVPFDLTKVMFITTANVLDTIPPALRDRMEVLELPGYTQEEKVSIARRFLIPKQLDEHGLKKAHCRFDKRAIVKIIRDYTREAGLRNLEREIGTCCRKVARKVAAGDDGKTVVTSTKVSEFLGPVRFLPEVAERTAVAGVATGMAWTTAGGEILFVESTKMRGRGKLNLTGQLGDVMKESAEAALSYVRSRAKKYGLPEDLFGKTDIHVHVPAGAIAKDGPSAGITMAMSLVSLLTDQPVRPDVAMTGEITLRGAVLPVGGIKEKVLAALRAGIKKVVLPKKNEKDLPDVPEAARKAMEFVFVSRMEDVIPLVLADRRKARTAQEGEP